MRNIPSAPIAGVLLALAALWAAPSFAATSCLNDNLQKLCLDISSVPGDSVQPSGLGGTDTFVKYTMVFRNAGQNSTRHITLDLSLATVGGTAQSLTWDSFTVTPSFPCTKSGATISCATDKFDAGKAYTITGYALPPAYTGASTPTAMANNGTYGWNGNTKTTSHSLAVSTAAGRSWVPANKTVSLVTGPEATDPSQQVTPDSPLWAKITLPPRATGYYAAVFVTSSGPDSSGDCLAGLYASQGGVYVCRDTGTPTRWVQTDLPADLFTAADPFEVTMLWDASIVPSTQLPPNAAAPTGLPKWAIFHNQTEDAVPYGRTQAFSNVCDSVTPVAPCLYTVEQLGSGDWRARFLKPNDGSDMAGGPLLPLARVLDWIVQAAQAAGGITIGPVVK